MFRRDQWDNQWDNQVMDSPRWSSLVMDSPLWVNPVMDNLLWVKGILLWAEDPRQWRRAIRRLNKDILSNQWASLMVKWALIPALVSHIPLNKDMANLPLVNKDTVSILLVNKDMVSLLRDNKDMGSLSNLMVKAGCSHRGSREGFNRLAKDKGRWEDLRLLGSSKECTRLGSSKECIQVNKECNRSRAMVSRVRARLMANKDNIPQDKVMDNSSVNIPVKVMGNLASNIRLKDTASRVFSSRGKDMGSLGSSRAIRQVDTSQIIIR